MKGRKLAAGIVFLAFGALLPMAASAATEYREGDPAIREEGDPTILDDDYDQITISEEGEIVFYGEYAHSEEPSYGYVDVDRLHINLTKPGVLCVQAIADDIIWDCEQIVRIELRSEDFPQPDFYLRRYISGDYKTDDWTIDGEGHGYTRMDAFLDAGQYTLYSTSGRVTPYQYRFYFYPYETTAPIRTVFGSPEGYAMRGLGEEVSGGFTANCFHHMEILRDLENGEWSVWGNRITFDAPEDGYYKITLKTNNAVGAELDTKSGSQEFYVDPHREYDTMTKRWDEWCMQEVSPELLGSFQTEEKVVELTAGTHTLYMRYNVIGSFRPFYSTCYTVKVEKTEKVVEQKEQEIDVRTSRTEYFYLLF